VSYSRLTRSVREAGSYEAFYARLVGQYGADQAAHLIHALTRTWESIGRPEQIMPGEPEAAIARADWRTWLLKMGRGSGKSRTGAETVRKLVGQGRYRSIAFVAPTLRTARRAMIEHPESGILAVSDPHERPVWKKGDLELHWPNGAIGYVYTAEEPDGIRSFNGDLAWCEELGAWKYPNDAWSNLQFGLRLLGPKGDRARAIITTTPRPIELIKKLVDDPNVIVTGGTTYDNADNLDPAALKEFLEQFEGTRLGDQELLAELLGDTPGALWTTALLEKNRVRKAPELKRIVVAVDPATKDPTRVDAELRSDKGAETGIVVAGIGECHCKGQPEDHGFILKDVSGYYTPAGWAEKVAEVYAEFEADKVIGEENNGGALVESNIKTLGNKHIAYKGVNASRGKHTRAEPVSTLDERGKIHHVGNHPELEDQMTTWQPLKSRKSPDRMDARVWAITALMLGLPTGEWFTGNRTAGKRRA